MHIRRLRKISTKHLTLGKDNINKVPSRIQNPRTTRPKHLQKLPKDPKHLKSLSTSEQTKPWSSKDFLAQRSFSTAHRAKPVRPVWETGQSGFSLDSRGEHSPRVNSPKTKPRSPESLHGLEQDFGDIRNTS
jgi:hypothetical protein